MGLWKRSARSNLYQKPGRTASLLCGFTEFAVSPHWDLHKAVFCAIMAHAVKRGAVLRRSI